MGLDRGGSRLRLGCLRRPGTFAAEVSTLMKIHEEATHDYRACHFDLRPGTWIAANSSRTVDSNDVHPMGTC